MAQSGQPYSVYDYSGSVGSLYFGTDDELTNPIIPLKAGVTAQQAQLQGTLGVNAGKPVLTRPISRLSLWLREPAACLLVMPPVAIPMNRLNFDAFNVFNHPDFDAPNNDVVFFAGYEPPPVYPPEGSLGYIQHTVGSPRFLAGAVALLVLRL